MRERETSRSNPCSARSGGFCGAALPGCTCSPQGLHHYNVGAGRLKSALLALIAVLSGCGAAPGPGPGHMSASPPASTQSVASGNPLKPEHVLESFDPADATESFRVARPADLQVSLMTRAARAADRFPAVTVKVYNIASQDVIVGYEPGCVVVHCGKFEQSGPAVTFVQRREILRPRQPLEFELNSGEWEPSSTGNGPRDLLTPTELPPGRYPIWATFQLGGAHGSPIESPHDSYVVP